MERPTENSAYILVAKMCVYKNGSHASILVSRQVVGTEN